VLCPVSAPRLRVLRSACRRFVRTHRRYPDGRWGPLAGPLEHGIALPPTLGKFSCRAKPGTNRRRCYAQSDCPLPSVKSRFFCNFLQGGFSFLPLREYHLLSLALLVATSCEELAHVQVAPARQPLLRHCSTANALTSLRHDPRFGKILTTRVRLLSSWLNLSKPLVVPLVVRMRLRWLSGKARHVRHSSMRSSTCSATPGCLPRHRSASSEASPRATSLLGAANTPRRSSARSLRPFAATIPRRFLV
jgi:hypothetical protein